jgi:hypothetical protein
MCSHESLFGVLCLLALLTSPHFALLFSFTTTDSTMREHFIEIIKKTVLLIPLGFLCAGSRFLFQPKKTRKKKKITRDEKRTTVRSDGARKKLLHTKDLMAEEK